MVFAAAGKRPRNEVTADPKVTSEIRVPVILQICDGTRQVNIAWRSLDKATHTVRKSSTIARRWKGSRRAGGSYSPSSAVARAAALEVLLNDVAEVDSAGAPATTGEAEGFMTG